MGIAIGEMSMSYDDFRRMTLTEFSAIYDAYINAEEMRRRDAWQRMRLLAAITVQPHSKKKITPEKLLAFPWDKPKPKTIPGAKMSKEEHQKRIEAIMNRTKHSE